MRLALAEARRALGRVSPNPAVGAVVVREGQAVARGRTQPPPGPHAEVVALARAGELARGATLYVTLEPCAHHGRTPPCTEAILRAGVAEVHMAMLDPDPRVCGRGKETLERAGVAVRLGEGEAEARRLLEAYVKHRTTGRPFVIAKFAASLDGRIAAASGDSRWVSGPQAREWAHRLRAQVDAIAVGSGTVLADDPHLTARPGGRLARRQPLRVLLDSRGRIPLTARALDGAAPTLVVTGEASAREWRAALVARGVEVLVLPQDGGHVELDALLSELGRRGVLSLLVEGGGELLGAFFDLRLVDKVHAVIAPLVIGARGARAAVEGRGASVMAEALRLRHVSVRRLGDDILVTGYTALEKEGGR
ncbi:MAG: bifunctional diaminohydroxyphosphoribosylaminopyrimidine deaminase/5-amino-6-(5-phosphoribosylamino)uracil reductase RibD [Chloroflexota bacterium]|jgi:diaminohydroxyphosphoribosylaminopyrimidine deaminase/5-amino-6-(5-phosphoribosylamino)uracil reductase|nr:bifunctional diaminohydroxyphosphoribosylaminopyrimidine deaminase/5-amino-6-(5-phosphoribosylamino)uracil reductase RibD [Chloroflexota bacterium]